MGYTLYRVSSPILHSLTFLILSQNFTCTMFFCIDPQIIYEFMLVVVEYICIIYMHINYYGIKEMLGGGVSGYFPNKPAHHHDCCVFCIRFAALQISAFLVIAIQRFETNLNSPYFSIIFFLILAELLYECVIPCAVQSIQS